MSLDIGAFMKVLKEYEWDWEFKQIINEKWKVGEEKRVVDVEVTLGFFMFFRLVTDSPEWRVRVELAGRRKAILMNETIKELLDDGDVSAVANYMWASANTDKSMYSMRLVNVTPLPFTRLTITLRNESGRESMIRKMYVAWIEVIV